MSLGPKVNTDLQFFVIGAPHVKILKSLSVNSATVTNRLKSLALLPIKIDFLFILHRIWGQLQFSRGFR